MSGQFDRANLFALRRIDYGNSATAKPHINLLRGNVIADIVSIILETELAYWLQRITVVNVADSAFVICNEKPIGFRNVGDSLRRSEPGVRAYSLELP